MITHPPCILSDEATDVITGVGGKTYLVYKHPSTKITTIIDKATQEKEFVVAKEISCTAALWLRRSISENVMRSYIILSFCFDFWGKPCRIFNCFSSRYSSSNMWFTPNVSLAGFELVLLIFVDFIFGL